jgi:hypothetical protein
VVLNHTQSEVFKDKNVVPLQQFHLISSEKRFSEELKEFLKNVIPTQLLAGAKKNVNASWQTSSTASAAS